MKKLTNKKIITRTVSFVLALSITASFSLPVFAAGKSNTLKSSQRVGEQTQYIRETKWESDGKINQSSYFVYTPNTVVTPIVMYGNKLYGRSTLSQVAAFAENNGFNIIGGINADFFTLANGLPCGIVVNNGKLVSSDGWQYGIGFNSDGTCFIGKPLLKIKATSEKNSITVTSINKLRTDAGVYMLTDDFSSNTQISAAGLNVILSPEDANSHLKIGGSFFATVEAIESQSTSTAIPEGKIILTASSAKQSMLSELTVGERLEISVTSDDTRWNNALYTVGGGALIVENGASVSQKDKSVNPRSAVGIKSDGSLVLFSVDGRQSGYSNGMTLAELSDKLVSLGCVTALNLDGGGSTTAGLKSPGFFPVSLVNKPSDGSQRKCANFIFLASKGYGSDTSEHIHLYPERQFALPGAEISFSVKSTDNAWTPVEIDGIPTLSADASLGTITENNTLIVSSNAKSGKVYGELYGLKDETSIEITDNIDWFGITSDGSHEISQIALNDGEQLDLKISAYYKGRAVAVPDKMFSWNLSNSAAGSVDNNGVITAGSGGTFATLTVSYGNLKKTAQLVVGKTPLHVTDFENQDELFCEIISETPPDSSKAPNDATPSDTEQDLADTDLTVDENGTSEHNSQDEQEQSEQSPDFSPITESENTPPDIIEGENNPPSNESNELAISLNKDLSFVKYGYGSMNVKYSTGNSSVLSLAPNKKVNLSGASSLAMWVYGDGSGSLISIKASDQSDSVIQSEQEHTVDFTGWKRLVFSFPSKINAISFLDIKPNQAYPSSASLYFDNIRAFYGKSDEDLTPPVITLSSVSGGESFEPGALIAVRGTISDGAASYISPDNIKLTIDGTSFPFEYNRETGALFASVDTGTFKSGEHRLTITVEDSSGNLSRLSKSFKLGASNSSSFVDMSSHWASASVEFLTSKNIILGESAPNGMKFNPERMATRAEMSVIMARYMQYDLDKYQNVELEFSDADAIPQWAVPYVRAVYAEQIMLGKASPDGSTRFDPNSGVTRAEAFTLFGRTIPKGYEIKSTSFSDSASIPQWAEQHIQTLASLGIVNGYSSDNSIRALAGIKRAEIASVLSKLY